MNPEQLDEWNAMRVEQAELRGRLDRLEQRLMRFGKVEAEPPMALPVAVEPPPLPPPLVMTEAPGTPPERESLEVRIGTGWMVRGGVVLLVTSLPFLGDALYRNAWPHLGPASKVGLLYLCAGILAGIGAWLERSRLGREMPKVGNYARVVLAGGLAAVYYVTYAAHYYPGLRVIGSPLLEGGLLLGWAAFMVWLADRRDSETLATFAILLAFYTSAISEISGFTLVSNVPLAAGAVFLMRRHLWKVFPFASLLATFGSYGYWRYFNAYAEWRGSMPVLGSYNGGGFWVDAVFLLLYWVLFAWAVFSASEPDSSGAYDPAQHVRRSIVLPSARRAGFASLNNGAFFLLVTQLVLQDYPGSFWKWALGFGVVLLGLAEVGRRLPRPLDRATENAFLLEGVLLVTVGFLAYFSGWQLAIMLAVQSVVLLAAAGRRENAGLLAASVGTAALSFGVAMSDPGGITGAGNFRLVGPAIAAIMAFNSWLSARLSVGSTAESRPAQAAGAYELFALGLWLVWGAQHFSHLARFSLFALSGAFVFALGIETRLRRLTFWSYVLACAGLAVFWFDYTAAQHRQPIQLLGIACLVAQQQFGVRRWRAVPGASVFPPAAQGVVITAAVLTAWVTWSAEAVHWFQGGFTLAVAWSLYAVVVFAAGLALREKVYRWLGLMVLVSTLAHVILLDIWQLDSLERFVSLLCLGVVLLGIGYFYTRYQSRLRDFF